MTRPARMRHLTIYLLKEAVHDAAAAISPDSEISQRSVRAGGRSVGTLYLKTVSAHPPGWKSFFDGACTWGNAQLLNASASAVWIVPAAKRFFALTFGHGRHLLEAGKYEEHFGLRVTLNAIAPNSIKSIDRQSFDEISRHTRTQGSRAGAMADYGLDVEEDLLRAVTGVPRDTSLGKRMSGMDALVTQLPVTPKEIPDLLARYLATYGEQTYRTTYPWVDQVHDVRDRGLIDALNDQLMQDLRVGKLDRAWLAVPEIIDWSHVAGFSYHEGARTAVDDQDLHLVNFLSGVAPQDIQLSLFKGRKILCLDHVESQVLNRWPAYSCLYAEVTVGGTAYLLNNGKWYVVEPDFYAGSLRDFEAIPRSSIPFPPYNDASEGEYNRRLAASRPAYFAHLDAKHIMLPVGRSRFEFCDVYTSKRELVHVKKYGLAGPISHLCAQAVNSGRLILERDVREKVAAKLPATHQIAVDTGDFRREDYEVVLAIVSRSKGALMLPFFGILNVLNARRQLNAYGFKTALAKIQQA